MNQNPNMTGKHYRVPPAHITLFQRRGRHQALQLETSVSKQIFSTKKKLIDCTNRTSAVVFSHIPFFSLGKTAREGLNAEAFIYCENSLLSPRIRNRSLRQGSCRYAFSMPVGCFFIASSPRMQQGNLQCSNIFVLYR